MHPHWCRWYKFIRALVELCRANIQCSSVAIGTSDDRIDTQSAARRCYSFYIVCALAQAASPPSVLWAFTIDLLSQTMASSQDYLYASENLFWQWCRSGSWCDLQCPAHRLMPHHAVMSMARCGSWWLALHTHTHSLSLLLEIEIWSNRDPMDSIIIYDGG